MSEQKHPGGGLSHLAGTTRGTGVDSAALTIATGDKSTNDVAEIHPARIIQLIFIADSRKVSDPCASHVSHSVHSLHTASRFKTCRREATFRNGSRAADEGTFPKDIARRRRSAGRAKEAMRQEDVAGRAGLPDDSLS
ncbi:hypothetical protein [Pandoraea sp. ISTKB]|uniref:hypothetical protein n=1 Tax=Pandoraea sp. ISTKB TaxID=1586708 RepID=UPI001112E23A|nr:hypothetical protein [Pandoraea sp. ISTKB]